MGIQGLRKYIDVAAPPGTVGTTNKTSSSNQQDQQKRSSWDHVLFDLNCLVYQAYSKTHTAPEQTITSFLQILDDWIARVSPRESVTFVLDGSAPLAKLRTQRQRRRKTGNLDATTNAGHTEISITAGSLFMSQLETSLVAYAKRAIAAFGLTSCAIAGSSCPGEGEAKVSQVLRKLITRLPENEIQAEVRFNSWLKQEPLPLGKGCPAPESSILVVGNDIDLILTCLGDTQHLDISLLEPRTASLFDVGALMRKWCAGLKLSSIEGLEKVRNDFIFLFCLNGGDHYVGLGDSSVDLWKRYRQAKSLNPTFQLISDDLESIDLKALGEMMSSATYTGDADVQLGVNLLSSALWGFVTTATGECPAFNFQGIVDGTPMYAHIHAAVRARSGAKGTGRVSLSADLFPNLQKPPKPLPPGKKSHPYGVDVGSPAGHFGYSPLRPLMNYLALIPSPFHLPPFVTKALSTAWNSSSSSGGGKGGRGVVSPPQQTILHKMYSTNDLDEVLTLAQSVVSYLDTITGEGSLSAEERRLLGFRPMTVMRRGVNAQTGKPALLSSSVTLAGGSSDQQHQQNMNSASNTIAEKTKVSSSGHGRQKRARSAVEEGRAGGHPQELSLVSRKKEKEASKPQKKRIVRAAIPGAEDVLNLSMDV